MESTEDIIDLILLAKIWTECILIQRSFKAQQSKALKKLFYNSIDRMAIYLLLLISMLMLLRKEFSSLEILFQRIVKLTMFFLQN